MYCIKVLKIHACKTYSRLKLMFKGIVNLKTESLSLIHPHVVLNMYMTLIKSFFLGELSL